MCEVSVKLRVYSHPDPDKNRTGVPRRWDFISIQEDGVDWGAKGRLPNFGIIKIPLIPASKLLKLRDRFLNPDGTIYQLRKWRLRADDMPVAAKDKMLSDGEVTIKATDAYTGPYDYTWTQIRQFIRNDETESDETGDLT